MKLNIYIVSGRLRVVVLMLSDLLTVAVVWCLMSLGSAQMLETLRYTVLHCGRFWPVALVFLGMNAVCRLYHGNWMYPAMPLSPVEEFRRLFATALFSHLLLLFLLNLSNGHGKDVWLLVGLSGLLVGFFAQSVRNCVRRLLLRLRICQIPVALAGDGETAERISAILKDNSYIGFDVVLKFDSRHLRDIISESRKLDVKILLACQDERFFRAQLRDFSSWFNYIEYLPRLEVFPILGSHAVALDGFGGLEMMNQGRMKALQWEKRLLDCVLATLILLVASPLFLIIPLLVKLTSRGPIFYRAERLGRQGETFRIWKFRSMYADADRRLENLLAENPAARSEWRSRFKLRNDPRVTAFGRFLRKTSLDELPQVFNVLCGEMSVVGPRPIVEGEKRYYARDYDVFSRVRPGITGLWQCSGRSDTTYTTRVALDIYYILNWSPWMDIWICIRTVFSVLLMKGAR